MSTVTVIQCPTCSQKYRVDVGAIGTEVECQNCGLKFTAVDLQAPPTPPPPPRQATPAPDVGSTTVVSRETSLRLEGKRLAHESTHGMTFRQGVVIILLLLVGCGSQLLSFRAKAIPRWEYMVVAPPDVGLGADLNALGKSGWELVAARRATNSITDGASYEMIFKRPIQ